MGSVLHFCLLSHVEELAFLSLKALVLLEESANHFLLIFGGLLGEHLLMFLKLR